MTSLWLTFSDRYNDWLFALGQHVQLSLSALLLAIAIAVPLGIAIAHRAGPAETALQLSGIIQTIPSLAILGLMIPFFGIGAVPALIALVVYALFPILQGTLTGLQEIPPELQEAGAALGMNRWEKLKTYELPLALPIITGGIRTAAIMIIGTATLAALIGAGGLGSFILLGIDRSNNDLIVIGAVTSAILAMLFSYAIHRLERTSPKTILLTLGLLTLGVSVSFLPFNRQHDTIVIAGKLGPEPEILINMYSELIKKDTNLSVELKPSFGKTTFLYEALKNGDIDIYPEFTGTITASLLQTAPPPSTDARQVYLAARDGIKAQDDLVLLEPMAYENTYAVAVPRAYAAVNHLQSIDDLAKVQRSAQAGFTLEFNDREDGNRGLQSLYGLQLNVRTVEPALRYEAVSQGAIQITDAYSTDSELKQYDLVVLRDDRHLFPPYQGAPLLRQETLDTHPELKPVLEKLAGMITAEEMSAMNYEVRVNGRSAHDVAVDYLKSHQLL